MKESHVKKAAKVIEKYIKQPSTIKGIYAICMGISIFVFPDRAAELVAAWMTAYGLFETGRNESKTIKKLSDENEEGS